MSLTPKGQEIAQTIISKHNALKDFFEKILGLEPEEATVNACKIEHVITETALKRIEYLVENQKVKT